MQNLCEYGTQSSQHIAIKPQNPKPETLGGTSYTNKKAGPSAAQIIFLKKSRAIQKTLLA